MRDSYVSFLNFCKWNKLLIIGLIFIFFIRAAYIELILQHDEYPFLNKIYSVVVPNSQKSKSGAEGLLVADALLYDYLAWEFANGRPMAVPGSDKEKVEVAAPGFPVYSGIIYFIFGKSLAAVLFSYALLDTLTALLLIVLFRKSLSGTNRKSEFLFLGMFALYAPYVITLIAPLTEGLFTFLVVLFFVLLKQFDKTNRKFFLILSGVILGFATLTRPITLLFPVWLAFWDLIVPKSLLRKDVLLKYTAIMIVTVLTIIPWSLRNYFRYDKLVLVSSNAKLAVVGTDLKTSAGEVNRKEIMENYEKNNLTLFEIYGGLLIKIVKDPAGYLKLWGQKCIRLWFNLGFPKAPSLGSLFTAFAQALLLLILAAGIIKFPEYIREFSVPLHFILYVTVLHILFFTAKLRFIIPVLPILLLVSSFIIFNIQNNFRLKKN